MSYLVLARKWRPQTFGDLIGQEHVSTTLRNAIASGRVAHAFLFTGARGVGKTSAARILAKALNCEGDTAPEPCNNCPACTEITAGTSVDVQEIDGASNTGVDDVRELRENIKYLPSRCRHKIFIIDEVHMLSTSAFNALLKTLEEPPPHVKFIFATTEPHKLPITILSRCQRYDFRRIPLPTVVARLREIAGHEEISISDVALSAIARKGDGSMRDALSTLDQVLAFCGSSVGDEEVTGLLGVVDRRLLLESSAAVFARDCRQVLEVVRQVDEFGYSMRQFGGELLDHFRNLLVWKAVGNLNGLAELAEAEIEGIGKQAQMVPLEDLQRHVTLLLQANEELARASFPRLVLELTLIKMANLVPVVPVEDLLARLGELEVGARDGGGHHTSQAGREGSTGRQTATSSPPAAPAGLPRSGTPVPVAPHASDTTRRGEEPVGWAGFVAFIRASKPLLASLLEHGHPLVVTPSLVEIGFAANSFHLSRMRDDAALADLKALAVEYFKDQPEVRIKVVAEQSTEIPPTLEEKKKREREAHRTNMRNEAEAHPLVTAALRIFGGEIGAIRCLAESRDNPEEV